jgi:hypothetical protein
MKAVEKSDLEMAERVISTFKGDEINRVFNTDPPFSFLDVAIQENNKDMIKLFRSNGALTYKEILNRPSKGPSNLPPLYPKGLHTPVSKLGIASRGGKPKRKTLRRTFRKTRRYRKN